MNHAPGMPPGSARNSQVFTIAFLPHRRGLCFLDGGFSRLEIAGAPVRIVILRGSGSAVQMFQVAPSASPPSRDRSKPSPLRRAFFSSQVFLKPVALYQTNADGGGSRRSGSYHAAPASFHRPKPRQPRTAGFLTGSRSSGFANCTVAQSGQLNKIL